MKARKRAPRIVGGKRNPIVKKHKILVGQDSTSNIKEKSEKEKIYDIIYRACTHGYHFADQYYGIPFIEQNDLTEEGDGLYVIRFRCEPQYMHQVYFGRMCEEVCRAVRSEIRYIHERKREWGIPYEECAWILKVGEKKERPFWMELFMDTTKNNITTESKVAQRPKKCTHVRWEGFLQSHYNRSLLSVAQELGYSEQNLDLLRCDDADKEQKRNIYKKYQKLFDSFLHDEWNKELVDGRNVLDYFKDLIASWVGEDLLVKALNEYGFSASLANADKDRVIKTARRSVSGEPDIKIEYNGNVRYLELMDALSPVEKYGQFDLRLSKAKNQFNRGTLFMLHGLYDGKYVLIDFLRDNITVTYNYPNPRFGNKKCSVVRFEENGIGMHEMAIFWESLKDIMETNVDIKSDNWLKMVDFASGSVEVMRREEESSSDELSDSSEDDTNHQNTTTEAPLPPEQEIAQGQDLLEIPVENIPDVQEPVVEETDNGAVDNIAYTQEQLDALTEGF